MYKWILFIALIFSKLVFAGVDTLKGTADIEDCRLYGWSNCNTEILDEDCKRYNSGGINNIVSGNMTTLQSNTSLLIVPGWDHVLPDSSKLQLYCYYEWDTNNRKIFVYPITKLIFEGTEAAYNTGDYPNPDSGATWNHAWLDDGDNDSLTWSTPGGDYTTAIACTTTVTGTGQYFTFNNFNRILNYWDTSGNDYGCILINEDAFPFNTSAKAFRSTEYGNSQDPLVILYTPTVAAGQVIMIEQ